MKNQLVWWTIWFLIIVLSAFIVPFSFLSGITRITGAFLYWGVFANRYNQRWNYNQKWGPR